MCGIAGLVNAKGGSERLVRAMCGRQMHRGPDGEGFWSTPDARVIFGHRRLSIIDLSHDGTQPMSLGDRDLTITFNGEIYNYLELREELQRLGATFKSSSDTEVLLRAYEVWGEACVDRFNGMFAFAIWDGQKGEIFCARDRFGEKPFHYAWVDGAFVFASEAGAVALAEGVDLSIHEGLLASFFHHGSTILDSSEATLFRGVKQLLPAHAMTLRLSKDGLRQERMFAYWRPSLQRRPYGAIDLDDAANELLWHLRESIRLRLRSDVRVGSCLSGGLDSSTIVGVVRMLEPDVEFRTFTGRFPGDPLDEGKYARLVVDSHRTVHHETEPNPERFLREAAHVYRHAEFPIGGMSQFAQYCVFGLAKEHDTTVLLDGQGSDEQLGGYGNRIVRSFLQSLLRAQAWRAFLHERRAAALSNPNFSWPKLMLHETPLKALAAPLRQWTGRPTTPATALVKPEWLSDAERMAPPLPIPAGQRMQDDFSDELWLLSFRTMLSSLLRYGDRLSMAHSREVRLPFCDPRLTEYLFSLPPELLVGEGQVKRVLRRAIVGIVPPEIVTRAKQGFVPPQVKWLGGPLVSMLQETFRETRTLFDGWSPEAEAIVFGDEALRGREVDRVWDLLNLSLWLKHSVGPVRDQARHSVHRG